MRRFVEHHSAPLAAELLQRLPGLSPVKIVQGEGQHIGGAVFIPVFAVEGADALIVGIGDRKLAVKVDPLGVKRLRRRAAKQLGQFLGHGKFVLLVCNLK